MEPVQTSDDAAEEVTFVGDVVGGLDADGNDPAEVLEALARIRVLRERLTEWEPRLIDAARAAGVSWAQLAPALGVASRQAAERRYLRLNPHSAHPAMTGEQRVQAARDQRASDRAVAAWARDNAADLRRLAGQITALAGLDRPTQASVDRLHHALGNSDSAALLAPLAETGTQLGREHPHLADQISAIEDRTNQVRAASKQRPGGRESADQTKQKG